MWLLHIVWMLFEQIQSSPPTYSLERVMAAFKMRGHLLLAEIQEKEEVYCPFIEQQAESKETREEDDEEEEEESVVGRNRFRWDPSSFCVHTPTMS